MAIPPLALLSLHDGPHRHLVLRALYGHTPQARSGAVRQLKALSAKEQR